MKPINLYDDMFFGATPKIFDLARQLRERLTPAEEKLWAFLSESKPGSKFRRQHPLHCFIADFYCHELKLVIEVDGEIHALAEASEYNIGRSEELEKFGITVIRFTNDEIINDVEGVVVKLREVIIKRKQNS